MATKTRKCSRCLKNRAAKFFSGPRGRICSSCSKNSRSKASHSARVQETYGLKPGEYDYLFQAQDGRCAICGGTRRQRLSVDHCHKTGRVRGLLCRMCNGRLLTAARDNPETLRKAASYLEDPPAILHLGERLHIDFRKDSD
ncbi:endonuclease VII domain-containing protein [Streptomyces sp. NPDC058369]|uniref:endonuclease VII domain-containing protein n=1 Tax=Streptomyces sp. NPDC058369 TaxID=3346462 RepID=UPI00364C5EE3